MFVNVNVVVENSVVENNKGRLLQNFLPSNLIDTDIVNIYIVFSSKARACLNELWL
jgi:hypothetical protein